MNDNDTPSRVWLQITPEYATCTLTWSGFVTRIDVTTQGISFRQIAPEVGDAFIPHQMLAEFQAALAEVPEKQAELDA